MARSGLLANFAAGGFLIVLHPFKVGDFVTVAGITGTIKEVGLFVTAITTPDNVLTMVGNNKIFSDTILNYSANPFRRVDLKTQLAHSVDHNEAIKLLKEPVSKVAHIALNPPPDAEVLEFNFNGPVLAVRPIATPITTGRSTSIPIRSSVKPSVRPAIPCLNNISSCAIRRRAERSSALMGRVVGFRLAPLHFTRQSHFADHAV
jgi:small conductance mechanosensitive channel